jgi:hypothetical protein
LGVEGECYWKEHGQRENVLGETVRSSTCYFRLPLIAGLRISLRTFSYNDDISLEDAIHTALLTLKEGFEGQMTEKTIEIGVVTVPSQAELEEGKVEGTGRFKPTFRKLTEEEIRDYLAL